MPTDGTHTGPRSGTGSSTPPVPWPVLRRRLENTGLLETVQEGREAPAPDTLLLNHLTDDSREVELGGGFVAIRGVAADGHSFIDKAVQKGARLVVCEAIPGDVRTRRPGTVFAQVTDTRIALAELAAALYGDPADALRLVGVTGTNGKTTVTMLAHHVLEALGMSAGLLSTVEVCLGDTRTRSTLTTPGPLTLHRHLRHMVEAGCTACAMEVSSHALDQRRVHGLNYEVAVFTNLTTDHLDYHDSIEDYRRAKKRLFDDLTPEATALYNGDDEHGAHVVTDTEALRVSFSLRRTADIEGTVLEESIDGLRLRIDGREHTFQLAGRFNAYNLMAAYGVGRALGGSANAVLDALVQAPPVPGRFEPISFEDGPTVIVDYAHTPDALATVLKTVRVPMSEDGVLWCVFGCGGDRDASKRPAMGRIAEREADRVIVTSDNPRTEAPAAILEDIRGGVENPEELFWIVDREAAIRKAAEEAASGDVVVIAGKGHETTQAIGSETRPFDDREVARRYFA